MGLAEITKKTPVKAVMNGQEYEFLYNMGASAKLAESFGNMIDAENAFSQLLSKIHLEAVECRNKNLSEQETSLRVGRIALSFDNFSIVEKYVDALVYGASLLNGEKYTPGILRIADHAEYMPIINAIIEAHGKALPKPEGNENAGQANPQ
jgi:hypothetical protein